MSDRASPPTATPVPTMEQKRETTDTEVQVKEEESLTLPSPTTSIAQSEANPKAPSSSPSRIRRTQAQRRAFLRADPQAQEVEPRGVLCRACQKWIKLSGVSLYNMANWHGHKQRCNGSATPASRSVRRTPSKPNFSPGSRVATAERKIVLLNDPQVRTCSPTHVQCGTCKSVVALEGEVDFELTKWTEHKEKCIPMTPTATPITPQGPASSGPRVFPPPSTSSTHSQLSASRSVRSPTPVGENSSNNSTERTAIAESPPMAVKVGVKRGRGEDEEQVAIDERPANRPRTETYKPPEKEAPSLFGWFMQPLKEFARGFRQGLGST